MRKFWVLILVIISQQCHKQDDYDTTLSARLNELKALPIFDNGVVVYPDSLMFDGLEHWKTDHAYYKDDIVTIVGKMYIAMTDSSVGNYPPNSPKNWLLSATNYHPYQYLRDTASTDDLTQLLNDSNSYIRVYAFAALAHRKEGGLFQIVVDNLRDTTKIDQITGDVGSIVSPADLMLDYAIDRFDNSEKDSLTKLILTKYTHLSSLKNVLLFHKPAEEDYHFIKEIAKDGLGGTSALIALSRYQKPEDVSLIQNGFKNDEYCQGYKIFFMAIESFPHPTFRKELIAYKNNFRMDDFAHGYDYYINALAAYRSKECLDVLRDFLNQPADLRAYKQSESREKNLTKIYLALKKYYIPMYDDLIMEIKKKSHRTDSRVLDYRLEDSPWNY